ncbi:helix-turn-helix domain-containing protein [Candidatus Daviesbacteria bacterium]|nr:helix-turn-helix domain-containing protein [Candidatus Daviesbacteria bacterium]
MFLREAGGNPANKSDEQVFIETKQILKDLADKYGKVVVIFSRFDQLKSEFDTNFLSNLQTISTIQTGSPRLRSDEAGKIVLILTSIKPLYEIAPQAITGGNINFYSENLYFKPYCEADLRKLLTIEPLRPTAKAILDNLIKLSGGHFQLLQILRRSQKQSNLLLDQFVKLQLKELTDFLNYSQRRELQKIALGKSLNEADDYLLGIGMVINSNFQIFTPLLSQYIKENIQVKLPIKEARLFKLLRNNWGKTVSKDEIFTQVWGENGQGVTDWALDALIYRLRKHPFIKNQGYIIENHKKVGYTLVQT